MVGAEDPQRRKTADTEWKVVEKLDEKRHFPRVPMNIPIVFKTGRAERCTAKLVNLSPDGVQVRADIATAQVLHPHGGQIADENVPVVQMSMILPVADKQRVLSICGRLMYLALVTDEPRCVMGLKFIDPPPKAKAILGQFFAEQLEF